MENAIEISKWFIKNTEGVGVCSKEGNLKLQKLLYYAQAMNLCVNNSPLFENKIEAWESGPVVRDAYVNFRYYDLWRTTDYNLDADTEQLLRIIDYIYGNYSASDLVDLSHSEDPWKDYEGLISENIYASPEISHKSMKDFYDDKLSKLYDLYKNYNFDKEKSFYINGNKFTYVPSETTVTEADMDILREQFSNSFGEDLFVYKDENEIVVY